MEGDAAPVEGDERPRVQHLGAEVGDLRGLAVVHLREEARVGHRPGVGGEDPGHVLPEHDARRAERAGEQRRGQVGAAAAEGGDGAVGAGSQEAGHDRGDAALQERREEPPRVLSRGGEVGGGAAVTAVGRDDLRRVHALGAATGRVQGRGHDRARGALPAGDEGVAGPVGEVGEGGHRVRDLAVLAGLRVGGGEKASPRRSRRDERVREVAVAAEERGGGGGGRLGLAGDGAAGAVEEEVGHAGEGGDHDHERAAVRADERHRVAHGRRVGERRPAELPDLQPRTAALRGALSRHFNSSSMVSALMSEDDPSEARILDRTERQGAVL